MQSITINLQPTPELIESFRAVIRSELANYIPPMAEAPSLPEYLTRKQTSEFLGVSYQTLNQWGKDTDDRTAILIPLKVNDRIRYRRSDVLAVLKESRRFKSDKSRG